MCYRTNQENTFHCCDKLSIGLSFPRENINPKCMRNRLKFNVMIVYQKRVIVNWVD